MAKIAFAYVPVLHEGYRLFLTKNQPLAKLYLLDQNWLKSAFPALEYLRKDLRCLPIDSVKSAITSWQLVDQILTVKTDADWPQLASDVSIILTHDDVGQTMAQKLGAHHKVSFSPIFLRWDRTLATQEKNVKVDGEVTPDELAQKYMHQAFATADQSSDWWRHVGAVLVNSSGEVLLVTANRHQPSDQTPYELGDTRSLFKQGKMIEMSTASHAESSLIAVAAKAGIKLAGCALYVTDFPCPYCARVIAASGVTNLFFSRGYTMMDGADILKESGILIQRVILPSTTLTVADVNTHTKSYPS